MKKNDCILVLSLLLISIALIFLLNGFSRAGATVVISVNNEPYGEYSLDEDREITISTEQGYNKIVIRDGTVRVTEADCRDGICKAHPALMGTGDAIVCLPHGVVIEVRDAP